MKEIIINISFEQNYFKGWVEDDPTTPRCTVLSVNFIDLINSLEESIDKEMEIRLDNNIPIPEWYEKKDYRVIYKFKNTASLLKAYSSFIPLSAISRNTGINKGLLSHYATGLKKPRKRQRELIVTTLKKIGNRLTGTKISDDS